MVVAVALPPTHLSVPYPRAHSAGNARRGPSSVLRRKARTTDPSMARNPEQQIVSLSLYVPETSVQ